MFEILGAQRCIVVHMQSSEMYNILAHQNRIAISILRISAKFWTILKCFACTTISYSVHAMNTTEHSSAGQIVRSANLVV